MAIGARVVGRERFTPGRDQAFTPPGVGFRSPRRLRMPALLIFGTARKSRTKNRTRIFLPSVLALVYAFKLLNDGRVAIGGIIVRALADHPEKRGQQVHAD